MECKRLNRKMFEESCRPMCFNSFRSISNQFNRSFASSKVRETKNCSSAFELNSKIFSNYFFWQIILKWWEILQGRGSISFPIVSSIAAGCKPRIDEKEKKKKKENWFLTIRNRVGTENCLEKRAIIPVPCLHDQNCEMTMNRKCTKETGNLYKIDHVHERPGNRRKYENCTILFVKRFLEDALAFLSLFPHFSSFPPSSLFGVACRTVWALCTREHFIG